MGNVSSMSGVAAAAALHAATMQHGAAPGVAAATSDPGAADERPAGVPVAPPASAQAIVLAAADAALPAAPERAAGSPADPATADSGGFIRFTPTGEMKVPKGPPPARVPLAGFDGDGGVAADHRAADSDSPSPWDDALRILRPG